MENPALRVFVREYAALDGDVDSACIAAGVDADEALDYLESEAGQRALARAQRRRGLSVTLADGHLLNLLTDPATSPRERLEGIRLTYQRFGEDGASRQAEAMERNRLSSLTPQEYWLYVQEHGAPGLTVDARILEMAAGRHPKLAVPIPKASGDSEAGDDQYAAARGLLAGGDASRSDGRRQDEPESSGPPT